MTASPLRPVEACGLRYGSVCSGIEAATVAWHPLGWRPAFYSEIDAFPCAVLSHYYPHVPNLGDMTRFQEWPDAAIDVLVGGTPCQAFSVAGLRKGLADPRGGLALTFLAIAARYRPDWILWENVPGVLSLDGGRAFGSFLGGLGELGYGWAYRILDAQYFGLAQRRPRVFVVASARGWAGAAAVLFESACMQGNPAPCREAREDVAGALAARTSGGGGLGTDFELAGGLRVRRPGEGGVYGDFSHVVPTLSPALNTQSGQHHAPDTKAYVAHAFDARQSDVCQYGDKAAPLDPDGHTMAVAFAENNRSEVNERDVAYPLKTGGGKPGQSYPAIRDGMVVRRLTPRECERLQGFPDDYTRIPFRGKPATDTPRYKALGNSMPVPAMRWLGERIALVSNVRQELAA